MSIYTKLDPMSNIEHNLFLKTNKEGTNIPNMAYPNQHVDIERPHGSKDHAIVTNNMKITFNLDIESTDKTCSIVNNIGRALVNKKVLMLGSSEVDAINNADI